LPPQRASLWVITPHNILGEHKKRSKQALQRETRNANFFVLLFLQLERNLHYNFREQDGSRARENSGDLVQGK
jgi:hypothetical protein